MRAVGILGAVLLVTGLAGCATWQEVNRATMSETTIGNRVNKTYRMLVREDEGDVDWFGVRYSGVGVINKLTPESTRYRLVVLVAPDETLAMQVVMVAALVPDYIPLLHKNDQVEVSLQSQWADMSKIAGNNSANVVTKLVCAEDLSNRRECAKKAKEATGTETDWHPARTWGYMVANRTATPATKLGPFTPRYDLKGKVLPDAPALPPRPSTQPY